jgi:hypothetical protein
MKVLDQLRLALPPPRQPFDVVGDWHAIEVAIKLRLPSDYKEFLAAYGTGMVNNCLEIVNPLRVRTDLRDWWTNWAACYHSIAEFREVPYPVFPQAGGLLPFGTLGDVDILNWRTTGEPEGWPFVYYDRDQGFFEIQGLSAVEFILEAVTQRSPLLVRLGSESAFDPPCDFAGYGPEPHYVHLVHPHEIDMQALVDTLIVRWPADQLRIRPSSIGIRVLVEQLAGSISVYRDGDERTWCWVDYDQSSAEQVEALVRELLPLGFSVIGRM